jgi:hypothetical protein
VDMSHTVFAAPNVLGLGFRVRAAAPSAPASAARSRAVQSADAVNATPVDAIETAAMRPVAPSGAQNNPAFPAATNPVPNRIPTPLLQHARWARDGDRFFDPKTKHTICEHARRKTLCKECGGGSLCKHGKQKQLCRLCDGSSLCDHFKQRSKCKSCRSKIRKYTAWGGGGGYV